jgi:hypothetical protein
VVVPFVPQLSDSVCPSAIFLAVVAVGVFPFDPQSGLVSGSHVVKEVLKLFPSGANANASTSVILVSLRVAVAASFVHAFPHPVYWMLAASNSMTMLPISLDVVWSFSHGQW